jgi:uncharacterized membrane protein
MAHDLYIHPGEARAADRVGFEVRHITLSDLSDAWHAGLDDFAAHPTQKVFSWLIYPIIGMILLWVASERSLLPILFPVVSGVALIGPFLGLALNQISRYREEGQEISHAQAFNIFKYPMRGTLLMMGAILAFLFFAWLACAMILYRLTLGEAPESIGDFLTALFTTDAGWTLIFLGNIVGFIFALIVFSISVVAFPLIIHRHATLRAAILTSVDAVVHNPGTMAVWGVMVAVLLLLGSLPAFIGLAVAIPILGHTTWHLYRKVVV